MGAQARGGKGNESNAFRCVIVLSLSPAHTHNKINDTSKGVKKCIVGKITSGNSSALDLSKNWDASDRKTVQEHAV